MLTFAGLNIGTKIAKIAIKQKTGARSLKSILENTMLDIMYQAPSSNKKEITITEIKLIVNNSGTFSAGTKFTIQGVRA